MKKKITAILLCLAMVMTMIPVTPTQTYAQNKLSVYCDGSVVENISLPKDEKIKLTADSDQDDSAKYQWQIYANDSIWVNIAGENGKDLELSYAMVASLLKDETAKVRCKMTSGEDETFSSDIKVKMDYTQKPETVSQETVDLQDLVIRDAKVTNEKITTPEDQKTSEEKSTNNASEEKTEDKNTADTSEGDSSENKTAVEDKSETNDSAAEEDKTEASSSQDTAGDSSEETDIANAPVKKSGVSLLNGQIMGILATATGGATDTPATYNVVINYVFENNEIVADPYTASLAAGTNFSATVTFPVVQGYLPYVNEEQKNSIELDYTNIGQDYTINVVYKPTNVDYTVIHYQQNVDNDKYAEKERETKQGLTNSIVPDVAKTYEGFYALLYEKPIIAADGSTVVEVYYDRYYYLMNFDLDGGYGVEPIYARYGAEIDDVGTPTKAGYTFVGWSLDGTNVDLADTMPAENRTYKAVWKVDDTAKVTVVFWGENADDEEYSYIKSSTVNVKPGTEFTYSENGSLICSLEEHTHNSNCANLICTQEEHTHDDSCYRCGEVEHTQHTTGCYEGVGNSQDVYTGVSNNPKDGEVIDHWYYGKLIYISGKWYKYTGGTLAGSIAPTICHKHTDSCLGCGKIEHVHNGDCYEIICGKTAHTHTSDCYMSGAGLDTNLWIFVKSDTVTVAADGSSVVNVYYDRTEKTLTFKYSYSNRNYQSTETITAKWGADISKQYKKIAANAGSTFWSAQTSGDGPYTNYFGIMPQTSATYYNRGTTGDTGTMTYWGQDLNGKYTVKLFEVTGVGGYYVTDEDRYEFKGFTYHHGTSNDSSCNGATFYYTRNSYDLVFNDGFEDVKTEKVQYEAPLSTYADYVPAVPGSYEPGSVTFGGWYLNPECTGQEYLLNDHKMPAENLLLYAKWIPVTHTVEFYLNEDALDDGTKLSSHPDETVPHRSKVVPVPADPTNGSYTFVGWFYMDGNVEKAFDFANMPVTKDMKVYGKWSSNVLKQYYIYYKYEDDSGNEIEIADPTTGSGLAGITKTFDAKGGTELYANYQEGYFPMVKSHSLTIDINDDSKNSFTFLYVQKDAVPYTVKYLEAETGKVLYEEKNVNDNRKAVVTETFVPISGYMPDAYQKRLLVSVDENGDPDTESNVIVFYYTKDDIHAYYKITHYTENLAKDAQGNTTWTEYASSQAVGNIGDNYSADPMTIPGFTYDVTVTGTVVSGKLTANGLELKLYYKRNSYPYQVRYLEQGTGTPLNLPKNGMGKYGEIISESAIDIMDYEVVGDTAKTLNIQIEEGADAKLNVITFYYKEKEVTINYEVVGPGGCGKVTPEKETVKVLSGTVVGSTPTANDNFRFVGWFTDKACTTPVNSDCVDSYNKFIPTKVHNKNVAATYYAKFEYDLADLTITKSGAQAIDEHQTFIFHVKGVDTDDRTKDISLDVVIEGNGSITLKDLPIGSYVVTEDISWSWRYTPNGGAEKTITLSATEENEVTFENNRDKDKWLDNSAYVENKFDKVDN